MDQECAGLSPVRTRDIASNIRPQDLGHVSFERIEELEGFVCRILAGEA